ncbi:MAG TPA: caspase family protein [Steroidobacteraceae bacterium]|nr:caspase family protein [Steroidobacteraceae bacterium]
MRGGEWVSYDRASLETALKVWLETAQAGDAEAQTTVGEIYERGLGVPSDYGKAAEWYQKAAQQGYSRALFNLGTLYEQGLGVEADRLKALNLYREASGIKGDDLLFQKAALEEQERQRAELQRLIEEQTRQIEALEKQVSQLERELSRRPGPSGQSSAEIETLRGLVAQLQADRDKRNQRLAALPARTREPGTSTADVELGPAATPRELGGMKLGRYYALVIGNQNYEKIEPLRTPINDAQRAATILRQKYGFSVTVIDDADDVAMLQALNTLNRVLKADDNLLIYYAGHGTRIAAINRLQAGYWLPVNADPPPTDNFWVPTEQVTAHLARFQARRVLVIADSCYAGLLSDDPSYLILQNPAKVSLQYVRYKLPKRSRLLMSSGGDAPVLDEAGQGNSVFARAFIDVLTMNQGVMSAPSLFAQLQGRVKSAAARTGFRQVPEFKAVKGAGHELGDFFFVPVATR